MRYNARIALRDENSFSVGTLNVVDRNARPEGLSMLQERMLLALSCSIRRTMKLRKAERELARKTEMLDRLHASFEDCIKVLDLEGRLRFRSQGSCRATEVDTFADIEDCGWLDFWAGTTQPTMPVGPCYGPQLETLGASGGLPYDRRAPKMVGCYRHTNYVQRGQAAMTG